MPTFELPPRRDVAPQAAGLPLFPLNAVLFPGGTLPLRVFEQRYMTLVKDCFRHESAFGICLIAEGAEVGAPALPHKVGTQARIVAWDMTQPPNCSPQTGHCAESREKNLDGTANDSHGRHSVSLDSATSRR